MSSIEEKARRIEAMDFTQQWELLMSYWTKMRPCCRAYVVLLAEAFAGQRREDLEATEPMSEQGS